MVCISVSKNAWVEQNKVQTRLIYNTLRIELIGSWNNKIYLKIIYKWKSNL